MNDSTGRVRREQYDINSGQKPGAVHNTVHKIRFLSIAWVNILGGWRERGHIEDIKDIVKGLCFLCSQIDRQENAPQARPPRLSAPRNAPRSLVVPLATQLTILSPFAREFDWLQQRSSAVLKIDGVPQQPAYRDMWHACPSPPLLHLAGQSPGLQRAQESYHA